ncbi:DUF1642 domain-containing protein [Enterococcus durans]|uniref:DUF1642 domain-containing protein n=1 Tax=Enterococcus durans TaxID=53345 RepID=UPI002330858E|nr:DUF1642 domain-containing protein [Enterococcus durans]WCG26712.1 DUF1642 domain-containing protein [Enterococcus durans]WCG68275.1 DUF1642 domain-containing protein [Enterococcus durans]
MNKQKLIDKYTAEISRLRPYCPNRHLISKQLKYDLYKEILEDLKQLDEPQKPKTEVFNHDEKFVVEWLDHTTEYHYSLYNAINDAGSELRSWMKIGFNSNRFAREFMSMDYEVEKEPLYYVRLPYEVWDEEAAELKTEYLYLHYEITSDETRIFPTKEPRKGFVAKLDELTIKSADENYWPFAVPVEEVAEG